MRPLHILSSAVGFLLLASPLLASAHETQHFRIGGKEYQFVIGSLNEPVTIDDKTGVDLTVSLVGVEEEEEEDHDEAQPHEHEAAKPVEGLNETLKVEISAGDKKRTFDLTTQYGKPGGYKAVFFPTVQTTLTYRLFGTLEGTPVDLSFSCNPAGHPKTEDDTSEVKISDTVTRTLKRGAFGCPVAKADLGFPEPSATLYELKEADGSLNWGMIGTVLGALGLIVGGVALSRAKKS